MLGMFAIMEMLLRPWWVAANQAPNGAGAHDNRRILVERQVLGQLVVGALDEKLRLNPKPRAHRP